MKKEFYIFIFVLANLISWSSSAQGYNKYCAYADYANTAYEREQIEKAISLMDSAIKKCPEQANNVVNWFNYALFYRTLAKKTNELKFQEKTLFAILKARELDVNNDLEFNINKVIKNVAVYYKNKAAKALDDTSSNFSKAVKNYKKYKEIFIESDANHNFTQEDIRFYNILAQRNLIKYENDKLQYKEYLDSAVLCYKKVIELDSTRVDAYLELATVYFNEAIELVNKLDVDAGIEEAMAVDQQKAELALLSIPLLEKVLEIESKNSKAIYSLAACYKILIMDEESNKYLSILKEVDLDYYNDIYKEEP